MEKNSKGRTTYQILLLAPWRGRYNILSEELAKRGRYVYEFDASPK
jgi:hypothetical protein